MSAHQFAVGMCGLSAKDERLLDIVLSRAPAANASRFVALPAAEVARCDIALVDAQSPSGGEALARLRSANSRLVAVFVSDTGLLGDSHYRIQRRYLLLHAQRVLEQVAQDEFESMRQRRAPEPAPAPASVSLLAPDAAFAASDSIPREARNEFAPLIALVVDDSLTVRQQLEAALQRLGIRCQQAVEAQPALDLLRQRSFDLILLDVVMPGMDGYELCREIKHNRYLRAVPTLMLTSRSSPFDRARGALAGCDSYLTKPITWDVFAQTVDKVLSRHFRNDRTLMAARGYRAAAAG